MDLEPQLLLPHPLTLPQTASSHLLAVPSSNLVQTALNQPKSRFFIALLPPLEIQEYTNQIKQHFADYYASHSAQKSPPHITLQPPFEWADGQSVLEQCLGEFANNQGSVPVKLNGFGAFPPRVIYINVLKTQELLTLQADLMAHLETRLGIVDPISKTRPFSPHMTVAFRDLTRQNFQAAWSEFRQRQLQFEFLANYLTLLLHDGKRWNISAEFLFSIQESRGRLFE